MKIALLGAGEIAARIATRLQQDRAIQISVILVDPTQVAKSALLLELAQASGIPVIHTLSELDHYSFDLAYMVSYPRIIPGEMFSKSLFVNTHYAPLPRYRGWHGLVWSIINDEPRVGYTVHRVQDGIDNGSIYYQHLTELSNDDTINTVMTRLDNHLIDNIAGICHSIADGQIPIPQDESGAIYVTKRVPADGRIDWSRPSRQIFNLVRALCPPYTDGAFTTYRGKTLYVVGAKLLSTPSYLGVVGKVVNVDPGKGVWVKTGDNVVLVQDVIFDGLRANASEILTRVGIQLGVE
jgi:methionyl-tRNA formyltransferase